MVKNLKIGQYLAKIWKSTIAYFFGAPCRYWVKYRVKH